MRFKIHQLVNTPVSFNTNNLQEEEKPIDIRRIIGLVLRYWYLLVIIPLLSVGLAALYTRYLVSQYKISSTILIRKDDKQKNSRSTGSVDASMLFSGNASNVSDEIEILKSRTLMTQVLTELNVNPVVTVKGRLKSAEFYKKSPIVVDSFSLDETIKSLTLNIEIIDNQTFEIVQENPKSKIVGQFGVPIGVDKSFFVLRKVYDSEYKSYSIHFEDSETLSQNYLRILSVTPIKAAGGGTSNALSLSIEDAVPERGIDVLTKLVDVYNRYGVEDKNSGDKGALKFIDGRIELLTNEVNSAEKDIENYKTSQGITADVSTDLGYLFTKLATSDSKKVDLEIKKAVFKSTFLESDVANLVKR